MVQKCDLNGRNKITAIGPLAVCVEIQFWYNNWRTEEIKKIDRRSRKMLTTYKMHQQKENTLPTHKENSHIGHCTHISECTNVKIQ